MWKKSALTHRAVPMEKMNLLCKYLLLVYRLSLSNMGEKPAESSPQENFQYLLNEMPKM